MADFTEEVPFELDVEDSVQGRQLQTERNTNTWASERAGCVLGTARSTGSQGRQWEW